MDAPGKTIRASCTPHIFLSIGRGIFCQFDGAPDCDGFVRPASSASYIVYVSRTGAGSSLRFASYVASSIVVLMSRKYSHAGSRMARSMMT